MNLVIDDAEEVFVKEQSRKSIGMEYTVCLSTATIENFVTGRILLRGDNITLIMQVDDSGS